MAPAPSLVQLLAISAAMIAATTFVHVLFAQIGAVAVRAVTASQRLSVRLLRDSVVLVVFTLWLMAAHMAEIWLWALLFLRLGLFETLTLSLYFAAVSYTTLGFGDVVLPEEWGLLSGAAAANGLLLFGLSAAILVETSARLRLRAE